MDFTKMNDGMLNQDPPPFFYKQEAHGPHRSLKQQFPGFLVLYFIANAISI